MKMTKQAIRFELEAMSNLLWNPRTNQNLKLQNEIREKIDQLINKIQKEEVSK